MIMTTTTKMTMTMIMITIMIMITNMIISHIDNHYAEKPKSGKQNQVYVPLSSICILLSKTTFNGFVSPIDLTVCHRKIEGGTDGVFMVHLIEKLVFSVTFCGTTLESPAPKLIRLTLVTFDKAVPNELLAEH